MGTKLRYGLMEWSKIYKQTLMNLIEVSHKPTRLPNRWLSQGRKINAAASAISTAAAELNQGFTESLNDFADVLNRGFLQSLSEFSEKFTSSVTQLTGFQDEIRKLHQEFQEAANQKLDQQTEKLNEQNQNLVQAANALDKVLDSLKDYEITRKQIDETLREFIRKATETNTSIYTENREWFEKVNADNLQQLSAMQNHLAGNLETLKQNLANELGNLSNGLTRNFEGFQQVLDSRLEVLNERLENFDTPLKNAVDQVKEAFDKQLDILNKRLEDFDTPLTEASERMRNIYADSVRYMQGIFGDLKREIIEQNEKYEAQLTGVKSLNESVKNLLTQLDESSKNQKEAVNTLSTNVGGLTTDIKNLDIAINAFTSDSGDLSQSVGAITGDIEKLGTASQQFVEKVEKADVTPTDCQYRATQYCYQRDFSKLSDLSECCQHIGEAGQFIRIRREAETFIFRKNTESIFPKKNFWTSHLRISK